MKKTLLILLIAFSTFALTGCPSTSDVKPYIQRNTLSTTMQQGIVFSLPKTVFQVKITYSLYTKTTWPADAHGKPVKLDKYGKLAKPIITSKIVAIDKPVEISTQVLPDPTAKFIFDTESLAGFTKDTDITIDLTSNGLIKSSNLDIKDKTKEIISNATGTIINAATIAAVAGADAVELTLVKELTVTRVIDPSLLTFKKESSKFTATYSDAGKAEKLFDNLTVPEVKIIIHSPTDIHTLGNVDISHLKNDNGVFLALNGLPYRPGNSVEITVNVDDQEVYDSYHMVAQAGGLALIPVNAKSFTDITQGLSFGEDGASLAKFTSKGTSRSEAISLTANEATSAILTGIQAITQAKVDKLKKEKELLDAETALSTADTVSDIQSEIDLLKKKKELVDAKLALKDANKKLEESNQ